MDLDFCHIYPAHTGQYSFFQVRLNIILLPRMTSKWYLPCGCTLLRKVSHFCLFSIDNCHFTEIASMYGEFVLYKQCSRSLTACIIAFFLSRVSTQMLHQNYNKEIWFYFMHIDVRFGKGKLTPYVIHSSP